MKRTRPVIAIVVALVAAVVAVGIWLGTRGSHTPSAARHSVAVPSAPAVVATVAPAPTGPPHDVVAAAAPTRLRMSGPAFTLDAHVCSMPYEHVLDPPGEQHHTVCWVRDTLGAAPGSSSATSYVLGHSWAPDPQEVLNPMSARATKQILTARPTRQSGVPIRPATNLNGYVISLWTKHGRLDYTVRQAYGVAKSQFGSLRHMLDGSVPQRLVLITCAERRGVDYPYNVIVEAYLTSSHAR